MTYLQTSRHLLLLLHPKNCPIANQNGALRRAVLPQHRVLRQHTPTRPQCRQLLMLLALRPRLLSLRPRLIEAPLHPKQAPHPLQRKRERRTMRFRMRRMYLRVTFPTQQLPAMNTQDRKPKPMYTVQTKRRSLPLSNVLFDTHILSSSFYNT